jgi:hypothetical protein
MANVVETILKLQGARAFVKDADSASHSLTGIGDSAEKSGEKAKRGWKGIAKWAGGTAAVYGASRYLHSAVDSTEELAKNTMALTRATGMDTKTSSAWAELLKVRGIDTGKFQIGMLKLSKTMEAARGGNQKAAASLAKYGVTSDVVASGNIQGAIGAISDSFAAMTNPAEKAALASTAFGKSGLALLPMLQGGSSALAEQIGMVDKYGATIKDTEGAKAMIAQQREMKIAMDGMKITLGTALMPAIEQFVGVLLKVVQALSPVLRNSTALYIVLGTLTTAYTVLKVATMVSTVMQLAFNAALLLIPLAIIAIVAGVIILYKRWKWFHDAVNNTFSWIKSHWQLLAVILVGPIAGAVILIVKNFGKIKAAVTGVWTWIKSTFGKIGGFISGIFAGAGGFVSGIGRGIADWINAHTPFGDQVKVGPLKFRIPALAAGGVIRAGGAALVGEQGPEIVSLPRGATVWPTPAVQAMGANAPGASGQTIVTKVYLDRRQIAEAVGTYASDRIARR